MKTFYIAPIQILQFEVYPSDERGPSVFVQTNYGVGKLANVRVEPVTDLCKLYELEKVVARQAHQDLLQNLMIQKQKLAMDQKKLEACDKKRMSIVKKLYDQTPLEEITPTPEYYLEYADYEAISKEVKKDQNFIADYEEQLQAVDEFLRIVVEVRRGSYGLALTQQNPEGFV